MSIYGDNVLHELDRLPESLVYGRVSAIVGLLVELSGVKGGLSIGLDIPIG